MEPLIPLLNVTMGTSLFLGGLVQTNKTCLHLNNNNRAGGSTAPLSPMPEHRLLRMKLPAAPEPGAHLPAGLAHASASSPSPPPSRRPGVPAELVSEAFSNLLSALWLPESSEQFLYSSWLLMSNWTH